jgi:outer membrane protein assembly factor BamB
MKHLLIAVAIACAAWKATSAAENNEPLPTFEEICFQARTAKNLLPMADAQHLLEPIGPESRLFKGDREKVRLKGLFRLRDWTADSVVRVNVTEPSQHLRIHVWGRERGVSLHVFPAGAAYRITQEPGGPGWNRELRLAMSALVTTDDRRGVRLPECAYQVRCQDGAVVVTKGDTRLMTVPLEGPAQKFYLELPGDATLTDLALFRSKPAPEEISPDHRTLLDGRQPSHLAWKETLPAAAHFEKLGDGCVELAAEDSTTIALATVGIAAPGICEIIVQIDDATPRSGIALLNAKGEALDGIEFGRDGRNPLAFNFGNPREQPWFGNFDFTNRPVPVAGPRQWLRLVAMGGWIKCSISGDGVHWGSVLDFRDRYDAWQSIALYVREPGDRKNPDLARRHIRMRSLQVRELSGLTSAVATDLSAKAAAAGVTVKSDKGESAQAWTDRIAKLKPAGASPSAWRYACVLQALAAPLASDAAESLLFRAVREQLSELRTLQAKINLLHDAALLWRSHRDSAERLLGMWDQLGREVLNAGSEADFSLFQHAAADASFGDPPERYGAISPDLARDAEILFYLEHRSAEQDRMERQVGFWRGVEPQFASWAVNQQPSVLLQWFAVRRFRRGGGRRSRGPATIDIARTAAPPLNRAASNILSELLSALDGKQSADAARILIACDPPTRDPHPSSGNAGGASSAGEGLVPAPGDDQLFVSFPTALRLLMLEHPELGEAMVAQIGPADQLKIEQALAHGDPVSVEVLPLQYCGTPAAALPCQWLGDRALAAADLALAASWYDEGLRSAAPAQQPDLAARKRLVSAMLGSAEGQPPTQPISFDGVKVLPEQFEGWIRNELSRPRNAAELASPADTLPVVRLPQPAFFQASSFAQLHDAEGRGFRGDDLPTWEFREVDWTWRHLAVRAAEDSLIACERSHIAAFDVAGGKLRWDVPLRNGWSFGPVRPLVCGPRIYVRAATLADRSGVACIDAKTGRRLWLADCGGSAAADPLWYHGRLLVPTMGSAGEQLASTLCLVELQAETGEVLSRRQILDIAEAERSLSECQASWAGNRLLILLSGSVICADPQGRVTWLRQESTLPFAFNPSVLRQYCQPAIESAGRVFVQQPGSCAIDCLSLETGQRLWRRGIVGIQAIIDLPDDRLLARTQRGLAALNKTTGEVLWQKEFSGTLSALARTTAGQILCARQAMIQDKPQLVFLWIDPATGQTQAHSTTALERNQPVYFGPFVARGDRLWSCFGYGAANDAPTSENEKRIIELRPAMPAIAGEGP